MWLGFYNISIWFYYLGIRVFSFFNAKAKKWIEGRKNIWYDLPQILLKNKKTVWFHCASVGEFEQAMPLYKECKINFTDYHFVFSFFSPSGYEFVKDKYPELAIFYLPLDTSKNAKKLLNIIQPEIVFFIKYEFWYHILFNLKERKIPTFLVSAHFRSKQIFFKAYGSFFKKMLTFFTHIFVQNMQNVALLEQIHVKNVSAVGDTRFARVIANAKEDFEDTIIEKFIENKKVFIAGSVWNEDIAILKSIISSLDSTWKTIIIPHEIQHFDYSRFFSGIFYSKNDINTDADILFIDKMGLLSKLYRYGNLVYIGGGFGKGVHNVLEPAIYKIPILIGPNSDKFAEVDELVKIGMIGKISNEENLKLQLDKLFTFPTQSLELLDDYLQKNANAAQEIIVLIKKLYKL